jgi:hypothetical protein
MRRHDDLERRIPIRSRRHLRGAEARQHLQQQPALKLMVFNGEEF